MANNGRYRHKVTAVIIPCGWIKLILDKKSSGVSLTLKTPLLGKVGYIKWLVYDELIEDIPFTRKKSLIGNLHKNIYFCSVTLLPAAQ